MKFIPTNLHILIKPEEINDTAKEVQVEGGGTKRIFLHERAVDLKIKAVNKGTVVESNSTLYENGQVLVYYPYSSNKILIEEGKPEYHVIHERDVMGIVES